MLAQAPVVVVVILTACFLVFFGTGCIGSYYSLRLWSRAQDQCAKEGKSFFFLIPLFAYDKNLFADPEYNRLREKTVRVLNACAVVLLIDLLVLIVTGVVHSLLS